MNKEQIYDSEISPLMTQIIDICRRNKIAMVCSFHVPNDEDDALQCDTMLTTDEYSAPDHFKQAVTILRGRDGRSPSPLMIRTKRADGSQTLTAFLE